MHKIQKILSIGLLLSTVNLLGAKYTFGVANLDFLPYYTTDDGMYSGFSRVLFDEFAKDRGHTIEYKTLSIKRLAKAFNKGYLDFKFPDNSYWDASNKKSIKITYSKGVVRFTDGVMVLPKNISKGKSNLKVLGTVLGFTPFDYLDDIKASRIKIKENSNLSGLLKQAIVNRVDGVYINVDVAKYTLDKLSYKKGILVHDESLPFIQNSFHLSSIKYPDVIIEFNNWMKNNSSKVSKIKNKYKLK